MPRKRKPMPPAAVARLGGHARAKSMSPEARRLNSQHAMAVRWADRRVDLDGTRVSMKEAARRLHLPYDVVRRRVKAGLTIAQIRREYTAKGDHTARPSEAPAA